MKIELVQAAVPLSAKANCMIGMNPHLQLNGVRARRAQPQILSNSVAELAVCCGVPNRVCTVGMNCQPGPNVHAKLGEEIWRDVSREDTANVLRDREERWRHTLEYRCQYV